METIGQLDRLWVASAHFNRRKFDKCVELCTILLKENPYDQAVWFLKARALTEIDFIDDTDMEEEGVAEILMDENSIAAAPRPGTSMKRPMTGAVDKSGRETAANLLRPVTGQSRPLTGFARPGTSTRLNTGKRSTEQAFQGNRPGTSRPMSSAGRYVRLGTQSMLSNEAEFIDSARLDLKKFLKRPAMAKALCDYLLYREHNPRKALELGSEGTKAAEYKDWWWKNRLGKAYYQLGMYREAENQLSSSLKDQDSVYSYLDLSKVYLRIDQPMSALNLLQSALTVFPGELSIPIAMARIYDALNDIEQGIAYYKKALDIDNSCVEAIACLASQYFYSDQPEIALRFYRRLLQMGVANTEVWNNLGLCCFYSSQYDMALSCFEQARILSDESNLADVWYNISLVAVYLGDLTLAYQALRITVSTDDTHSEAYNNLGILEMRRNNPQIARSHFERSFELSDNFEPLYNAAVLAFRKGDYQTSYQFATRSYDLCPEHEGSRILCDRLQSIFRSH